LEELVRISPGRVDSRLMLAELSAGQGKTAKAEEQYRKILETVPHSEQAISGLTRLYRKQERYDEAVNYIESYLSRYPGDKRIRRLLAETYTERGWHEVAAAKYEEMLRDFPNDPEVKLWLGRSLYESISSGKNNDHDRAVYVLKQAAETMPENAEPDYLIGLLYLDKNYRELAVDHLKLALKKADDKRQIAEIRKVLAEVGR
ncbi:MAG: tetratricopeptide repeat protein, partial [Chitinivibrionales bacterium]|nr:tetratricopeptide repeat protein [Chitinivibrionales bacterium]